MFSPNVQPRTQSELLSLANEMAQRIAYDTREWQRLKVVGTFAGDGVVTPPDDAVVGTTMFDLPANFKRLSLTSNVWRSSNMQTPMVFVSDADEWLNRRNRGWVTVWASGRYWAGRCTSRRSCRWARRRPTSTSTRTASAWRGGYGDTFMSDGDTFVLGERLLKLGMIWQWKANKGSPYAEDMGTYSDALVTAMGTDQPAPIIIGHGTIHGQTSYTGIAPWPS